MARDFTGGSTDRVDVGTFAVASTTFSMCCWVWFDSITGSRDDRFISKADGTAVSNHDWMLGITGGGGTPKLRCRFNRNTNSITLVGATTVPTGQWVHAVATWDGSSTPGVMTIFYNGASDGTVNTSSPTGALPNNTDAVYIGNQPTSTSNSPDGRIAEVGIWNVVLTANEIASLARGVPPGRIRPENLEGYWPLGHGATEPDYSGKGRNGTVTGTAIGSHAPVMPAWGFDTWRTWSASGGGGSNVDVATAAGSLTLGGLIPTILNPRTVAIGLGSIALTGFASQLLIRISTVAGAAVLSGQSPIAVSPYTVPVAVGSLTASGQAPTAVAPYSLTAGVGQLTATGNASSLASTVRISAGSLTLSGQAPAASAPHAIATSAGSLTLGGFSPALDVSADRTVDTGAGSLTATGQSPSLLMVIPVAAASASLSGHAPAGTVSFVIPTAPGGLSLTGISPALLHSIAVGLGQMLLSGQAPSAVNPVTLSVGAGAVTLTAAAPTLDISADLSVTVGSASLALAGNAPAIGASQVIAILPASMLLTGQIPGVDLSNILAVVIQMRPADNATTSARNELQSNLVRMRHNLEVQ